jgi:tetratricopeptide (TPR) repeat protein
MTRGARAAAGALALLALAAAARAETTEEILFRARQAQLVEGDLELAIRLYRQALEDTALPRGRQAEGHLRLALCHEDMKDYARADLHLVAAIYAGPEVPAEVRRLADEIRLRVQAKMPKEAPEPPAPRRDERARIEAELRAARGFLESGDAWRALLHAKTVLDLDPLNAAAKEIDAEAERRLSGAADFIRDPLRFVRKWTETRITQVATDAQAALARGAAHADAKRWNLAEASFREALEEIDACEFGTDSDRLLELRANVVARWDAAHRAAYGKLLDASAVTPPARPPTPLADYLNQLQKLLDLVSSGEHEYRLLPVQAPRAAAVGSWQRTPEAMSLLRDLASAWSPALFARLYLPLRVAPDSWAQRDNFLEPVGDMLVARHRPQVLDALLEEVKRMEQPSPATLPGRFLLVPVPEGTLDRLEAGFGKFEVSRRGPEPVFFRVVPYGLDYLCSFLRDLGAEVRPAHDTFAAELQNGVPQTLFAAAPLSHAPAYKDARAATAHFGLVLDIYPLRDRTGRTATAMRLLAKTPVPPLYPDTPRYLTQEAELFADLPADATLVVTGILDPFATARPQDGNAREMVLLWLNAAKDTPEERPLDAFPAGADVSLGALLRRQRDFPGPRGDPELGFVAPEALGVLNERAAFLERFIREELGLAEAAVDVAEAVLRVPATRLEDAAQVVASMERESARSYVIEVQTRTVRSPVLARWLAREELSLQPIEGAEYALSDAPDPDQLLRRLDPAEPPDAFAPEGEWPKPTAKGLQARHVFSSRARTSPAYASEEDLATGETRTVTEGLRVTVRPYTSRGNTLRVELDIETCALEADEEERALALAIPSHRTRFSGSRVRGTLDLGNPDAPRSALLCRIPHPTESRPDRLVELVIALTVKRVP